MQEIERYIEKYAMLDGAKKLLCAVSGGADSMCLLHYMWKVLPRRGIALAAAHYNHKLRGEESDRDESFVSNWCRERKIEFYSGSGNVLQYAQNSSKGVEEAARDMRYAFLEDTAAMSGADRIATAHNADDQLETMLMNLARGAGARGLSGIPPVRGNIIRPLLGVTRADIDDYLLSNQLEHIEDSTNKNPDVTRNAIRLHIIPELKRLYPASAENASLCAMRLRDDDIYISEKAKECLKYKNEHMAVLSTKLLNQQPWPVAFRAAADAAAVLGITVSEAQAHRIVDVSYSPAPSACCPIAGGIWAYREYDRLIIKRKSDFNRGFTEAVLYPNQKVSAAGNEFILYYEGNKAKINYQFNIFCFKKTAICGKITVRPRKTGDSLKLSVNSPQKTLKKLFIEKKIPASEREMIPVIADEKGVLAVLGFGIDIRAVCGKGDEAVYVSIKKQASETGRTETDNGK